MCSGVYRSPRASTGTSSRNRSLPLGLAYRFACSATSRVATLNSVRNNHTKTGGNITPYLFLASQNSKGSILILQKLKAKLERVPRLHRAS